MRRVKGEDEDGAAGSDGGVACVESGAEEDGVDVEEEEEEEGRVVKLFRRRTSRVVTRRGKSIAVSRRGRRSGMVEDDAEVKG